MFKALKNLFILNLFAINFMAFAIIPAENIQYPKIINKDLFKQLTEAEMNDVVNKLQNSYSEILKKNYNAILIIDKVWDDNSVNAYATRTSDNEFHIHLAGGIARAKGMTKDSLALVLCHELGHHLGGAPKSSLYNGWPSAEGQADYWATSKCLKKYFFDLSNESVDINSNVPDKVIKDCDRTYSNFNEMKICVRSVLASLDFANFLNQLPSNKIPIKLETPDTRVLKGININDYPRPQCRFDTLYAGALCPISFTVLNSNSDPAIGACMDKLTPGFRPVCWYGK